MKEKSEEHNFNITWEELDDHRFKMDLICPDCGRHVVSLTGETHRVINIGDNTVKHNGISMLPMGLSLQIGKVRIVEEDEWLEPFKEFFNRLIGRK